MDWIKGDLARFVLGVLIFLLVIYESKGSVARPSLISPSKPELVSQIVEEIIPSVLPSASSDPAINTCTSSIAVSPSPDSRQSYLPHRTVSPAPKISPPPSMKDIMVAPSYSVDSRSSHEPSPTTVPTGSVVHPPFVPPSMSKVLSPVIQQIAPSVQSIVSSVHISPLSMPPSTTSQLPHIPHEKGSLSSSPLSRAIKEHNSQREITPNQATEASHATADNLSSAHANPPATQIRDAGDMHGKSLHCSLYTLQHAPAPSPRMLPFNPQNVQPNSRGTHPSITSPSSAKGFHRPPMASTAATSIETLSHFKKKSKKKRRHFAPRPDFDGCEINPSASHAPILTPKHKRSNAPSPPYIGGPVINPAPSHPPVEISNNRIRHYAPPPYVEAPKISPVPSPYPQGPYLPPVQAPFSSSNGEISAAPLQASTSPPSYIIWQIHSPEYSPSSTFGGKSSPPSPQPKRALPPPPPNLDCGHVTCQSPLTNPCAGSLCTCVMPIKVGLRLGVALYIFFPLVSELAKEIATGVSMKQSQVRIMGANSATEDSQKTDVLIDLVPLGQSFDKTTVFLTFEKFWKKQVSIQASYFGDYGVLYVNYPGLPPSPPTSTNLNGEAYGNINNGRTIHPLAVDVRKNKKKLGGSLIAIIAMTSLIALVLIIGAAWLMLLRNRELSGLLQPNFRCSQLPIAKSSATEIVPVNVGIGTSASLIPSIATYNGSAKTFTLAEMERTTNRFDDSRLIGEGGFGRVYQGTLEDGTMVAVKVLKRVDKQGEREFLAEIEMLKRLHHRNLVKLMGICTEENVRCLVYELIPNGSVDSHLHGVDKETAPLDWNARVKIALGAARALAYLHEDSSPRVIHRDFKSSNILLEHDFTPRVSDFGLARSALDEGKEHISTRVMGTFGYVDPEYAMTGHLLVKSDVYSYGVVLIELLTGRKPIDMSQPPGQENLVAWTRSLLTNMEGLQTIIDGALGANYPQNSVAKVAAIASMCVQPEVSHRPLMSEVVQALKLVWNESDEYRLSESYSHDEMSVRDVESGVSVELCQGTDRERPELDVFCASSKFAGDASGSFRRYSTSSAPLRTTRSSLFWQRERGSSS